MADNINFSPEMINNLVNLLRNNDNDNDTNNESNSHDFSSSNNIYFNKLDTILSSLNSSNTKNDSTTNNSDSNNINSLDFETILKIKSIIETMNNKNDPRSNLLYSLKPYLRESKRSKIDQYANLLKITQVTGLFKNEKES